jgi:hypothetical protein
MLRAVLFHIALVMAPTILFILYLIVARKVRLSKSDTARMLRELPWVWLLGIGVALMAASLVAISLTTGGDREGTYVPPRLEDGKIVPSRIE